MTELRRPEPFDPKVHDRSTFDSGAPDLDEWLRRYSTQNRCRNTAATWVITTADSEVVAYVCLAMTSTDRGDAPSSVAKHAPDPVPALLIGRLAVDRSHAGLGIGTALVAHVLATAVDLDERAATRPGLRGHAAGGVVAQRHAELGVELGLSSGSAPASTPTMSRELAYVALSRARQGRSIYVESDDLDQAAEDLSINWANERRQEWVIDQHQTLLPPSRGVGRHWDRSVVTP